LSWNQSSSWLSGPSCWDASAACWAEEIWAGRACVWWTGWRGAVWVDVFFAWWHSITIRGLWVCNKFLAKCY
jgi:hypothetical protein